MTVEELLARVHHWRCFLARPSLVEDPSDARIGDDEGWA